MVLWRGLTGPSPQCWLRQSRVRGRTGIDSCRLSCSLTMLASNRVLWSHRFVCCMGDIRGSQSTLYSLPPWQEASSDFRSTGQRSRARCPTPGNWHDSVSGKHRRPSMTRGAGRPSSGLETVLSCFSHQPRLGRHASLQGLSMDPIVFWS